MKIAKFLSLACAALALTSCGSGAINAIVKEQPKAADTFVKGNDLWLRGTPNDTDWACEGAFKLTYDADAETAGKGYTYYIKGVTFAVDDLFKVGSVEWGAGVGGEQLTPITTHYFANNGGSDKNVKCTVAGTYDLYIDCSVSPWTMEIVRQASSLLTNQDLNYTRTTAICLNETYLAKVKAFNYFSCITVNRSTEFIDNGLYMHSSDDTTNSGYMTVAANPNDMYHYTLPGGKDHRDNTTQAIANVRHDSTTQGVNDFFYNGHYFHDNAATIAPKLGYDNVHDNYYLAYSEENADLFLHWMYFTAPLFTNKLDADGTKIPFTGLGIKDNGSGNVTFYLYADNSYLSNTNTYFATAEITDVGTTSLGALTKYISGASALPTA